MYIYVFMYTYICIGGLGPAFGAGQAGHQPCQQRSSSCWAQHLPGVPLEVLGRTGLVVHLYRNIHTHLYLDVHTYENEEIEK